MDTATDAILHVPPPAGQLPGRLDLMCRFANGDIDAEGFLHPVLRAVLLHFWLAYDHPFEDGNGRTARALFYWSMRREGYWLAEYLSISEILHNAPARYARAFLLAETDEGDATYFVLFHLEVVCRAIDGLHAYLRRKMHQVRQTENLIAARGEFNHRQLALLGHALRHPGGHYTFASHARSHDVTVESARKDLQDLYVRGLLGRQRAGKAYVFNPPRDLADTCAADRLARPHGPGAVRRPALTPDGFVFRLRRPTRS